MKNRRKYLYLLIPVIAFSIFIIITNYSNKSDMKANVNSNNSNNNESIAVVYTSFDDRNQSKIVQLQNGTEKNVLNIESIALENLQTQNEDLVLPSRYSSEYFVINKISNEIKKMNVKSKNGVTNTFNSPEGVYFITNGGLHSKEDGSIYYTSSIYNTLNEMEFEYDNGFFRTGTFYNNHIYVLSFDPSIEKELVIKLSINGEVLDTYEFGDKPNFGFNSLISNENGIYLFSNDGKVFHGDGEEFSEKVLDEKSPIIDVLNFDQDIVVIYENGKVKLLDDSFSSQEGKEFKNVLIDNLIYVEGRVVNKKLYLLFSYDRANVKEEEQNNVGKIVVYNMLNGQTDELQIPNKDELAITSFVIFE